MTGPGGASLQAISRSRRGLPLSPDEVQSSVEYTGTPQAPSTRREGRQLGLRRALEYLARAATASNNGPGSALGYTPPGSPFYTMPGAGYLSNP
jgi:hypothetical protein